MDHPVHVATWTLAILLATTITQVVSFSTGAIEASCPGLDPSSGHGETTATGAAPYTLELSKTEYQPGDVIQVTLRGTGGAQFKGFLVAARRADGESSDNIGEMSLDSTGNSKIVCVQPLGNALTHTEAAPKTSVEFTWTAPDTAQGDVVIHYTVVRGGAPSASPDRADYFKDLRSVTITGPDVAVTLSTSFPKDGTCGVSKGCYSDCTEGACGWQVTWQEDGDVYNMTLTSVEDGTDNKYLAIGVSERAAMGPASVVACIASGGAVVVRQSYNSDGYQNTALANPSGGLTTHHTSYADGILSCSFSKHKLSTDPQNFNLTESWYLITARGSASGTTLIQHDMTSRYHTDDKIDLSLHTTDITVGAKRTTPNSHTATTAPSTINFRKDRECGKTKGCYSNCDDDRCTLLFGWAPHNDTHFIFSMEAVYTGYSDFYVAMGFSTQDKMDVASVAACTSISGVIDVFHSFNPGYYNVPLANPKEGLSDIEGSMNAGVVKCTFTRVKASSSNSQIFDLSQQWYLIAALGQASAGGILSEHNNKDKYVSSKIDFSDLTVDISLEELDYPLIQAHAILMIIAWMLSGSIGLTIARFFKKQWPNSTIFGLKVWFQVHRVCMMLVFVMASVAIVLVFVEIEGYSEIHGPTYEKAHPVLGLITTGLMVINPIMAMFRPGPDHTKRWVFNWSHWAVGSSAHILAGVTITLGLYLPKAQLDKDPGLLIMLLYLIWQVAVGVTLGVLDYLAERDTPYFQGEKINSASHLVVDPLKASEPRFSVAKKVILMIHFFVLTSMCAFLVFLVIDAENN